MHGGNGVGRCGGCRAFGIGNEGYVLVKDADSLFGTARYVALLNLSDSEMEFTVEAKTLDLGGTVEVFDLADRSDPGEFKGSFTLRIRPHAAKFFRFDAEERLERTVYGDARPARHNLISCRLMAMATASDLFAASSLANTAARNAFPRLGELKGVGERDRICGEMKNVVCCAVAMAFVSANAAALVPAAREFVAGEGSLSVTAKVSYSEVDWYDFDRVGQCLAEVDKTVGRDSSLPPEGYRLCVGANSIAIDSADDAGEFYAYQTLRQLTALTSSNTIAIPRCEVRDWPAFRWRGLLIDEARHFLGKETVLKILDEMAMHKLNVLHWHLVDDQGWRVEIKRHPELVEYGSVRPCSVRFGTHASWKPPAHEMGYELNKDRYGPFFYTQDDVREIVAYAKARHITVMPEIELPGHVRALLAAHPEFICEGATHGREPAVAWSVQKEVLCVGNDDAMRFLEDVLYEVCELFPDAPFIHVGGDECPRSNWKKCRKCQARIASEGLVDESGLQAWITARMVRHIEKKGRRAVGWDEILAGDVPKSAVGMVWRSSSKGGAGTEYVSAAEAVGRGHDMVMAPNEYCYLNYMQGIEHDPYPYFSVWASSSVITLEKAYSFDPCAGIPAEHRGHILGGQICVWGESTFNVFDFEWKAWPRGCAIAEVLWLGDAKPGFADFLGRMKTHRVRLLDAHINAASL